jgi:hypothetical protein
LPSPQIPFPARSFDLLSMQYPLPPKAAGEPAMRTLLDTVRPSGLLLAVYHNLDDEHLEHVKQGPLATSVLGWVDNTSGPSSEGPLSSTAPASSRR